MFVLKKWPCSTAEWSELSCNTQLFEIVVETYSSSGVGTNLLTDEKIFTVITRENSKNHQLQQTRRKTSRQNACAHDQRSDSHWWHLSASHK